MEFLETRRLLSAAVTHTLLSPLSSPVAYGKNVTLTAAIKVDGSSVLPTGSVTFLDGTATLGMAAVNSRTHKAVFSTALLPVGVNSLTATYGGTDLLAASTSPAVNETVNVVATTTRLTASPVPAIFGSDVALTATVNGLNSAPGGTVTFFEGGATLGVATINTKTHKVIFLTSDLAVGNHNITASYTGANGYSVSSAVAKETIKPAASTTSLAVSGNPGLVGETLTFTATVMSAAGSPTGMVTFKNGSTVLGTGVVDANSHTATFSTTALALGKESITAVYDGAASFLTSSSAAVKETVGPSLATNTTLSVAPINGSEFGQTVTLTATVTATGGSPDGSVVFMEGTKALGSALINTATHKAVLTTAMLDQGADSVTAVFAANDGFLAGASAATILNVSTAGTTTTFTPSATSVVVGGPVTLTAIVTSTYNFPAGMVTFLDGATTLGIAAINTATHQAILTTSALTDGLHGQLSATYDGITGYAASNGLSPFPVNVTAPTTTTLTSSSNAAPFGQTITLTATVTSTGGTPGGMVTFMDGSAILGTASIDTSTHQAVFTSSTITGGLHSLSAVYGLTGGFSASTSTPPVMLTVTAATTTSLSSSTSAASFGQAVTLTATVTSTGGTPGGTVTFLDGAATLGSVGINTSTNQAVFTTSALALGSRNLTAAYGGVTGFTASTSSVVAVGVTAPTTTTLGSSINPTLFGQTITFEAVVLSTGGSATGNVTFLEGATTLGTVPLNTTNHHADFVTSSLGVGLHVVTAAFGAGSMFDGSSSSPVDETVYAVSATSLTASASNVSLGQAVTFTANVVNTAPGGTIPTGSVTFVSGNTTLGTAAVNGSGAATLSEYNLFSTSYSVQAIYSGDAVTGASTSATAPLTIAEPAYTTAQDGLQTATVVAGSGAAAQSQTTVEVDYTGYLLNGTKFDSSLNAGRTPFFFMLGTGAVIAGWDEGIPGMLVGETRILKIPAPLAYGVNGTNGIPGNSTLLFIVKMLAVNNPARLTVKGGANHSIPVANNQSPATTNGTDFGTQAVGISGTAASFELGSADSSFNHGNGVSLTGAVTVSGANPGDFILTQPSPQNSFIFTITFKPTAPGTRTATITLPNDDTDVPNFTFTVTGVGQ